MGTMSNKPDSQQIGLAGEYYVGFILSRLGYDVSVTIGRAKVFDMVAIGQSGKSIHIQVKSTYNYHEWLVSHFNPESSSIVALVRLGKSASEKPELYFLTGSDANKLIDKRYPTHSPFIPRKGVLLLAKDHDFTLIEGLLACVNTSRS
jgi:hypothetical protein